MFQAIFIGNKDHIPLDGDLKTNSYIWISLQAIPGKSNLMTSACCLKTC